LSTQTRTEVRADAKFLRRVLAGLVFLTVASGALAGFTTVQAMNTNPKACLFYCE
jgi:carbon starvation protein CstA